VTHGGVMLTARHCVTDAEDDAWVLRLPSPPGTRVPVDVPVAVHDTDSRLDTALLELADNLAPEDQAWQSTRSRSSCRTAPYAFTCARSTRYLPLRPVG
jgi:hypothetical protein